MIKVFVAGPSGVLGEWHFRDGQLGLAATAWAEGSKPTLTAPTEGHWFGYETDSKMMFSWQAFGQADWAAERQRCELPQSSILDSC
jgi:hypothetical protein